MARILSELLTGKKPGPQPFDGSVMLLPVTVVMPAVLAVGDLLELVDLPPFGELVDYTIFAPQLDSGTTMVAALGEVNADFTDLARIYEAGLAIGRGATGTVTRCTSAAASQAGSAESRRIALKFTATGAYVGAGKTVTVILHLRG